MLQSNSVIMDTEARAIESVHTYEMSQCINPLSANSDQDQFSPNNITLSTDKFWELIKWSPK